MINFIKNNSPIIICDIGAAPIDKTEFIDELFNNTNSKLIGFEPNEEEFNKLEKNNPRKTFYDYAIGDGSEKYLNICKGVGMSSFLEPDMDYLNNFYWFDEMSKIVKKKKIKTKKLDDIREKIDLLKIDVQGYEYEIIQHGKEKVKNSLVIQLETSPIPLYKNEKTSSEVINQLEKLGFSLHMFNKVNTKPFKPMKINNSIYQGLHHLFQLDCVMINNFQDIDSFNKEDLTKLILIMFYSFKSYDFVDYLIRILDKKFNLNLIEQYRKLNSSFKIVKKY
jgi:FkbM family methyltransferase